MIIDMVKKMVVAEIYQKATLEAVNNLISMSKNITLTADIIIDEWEKAVSQYTDKESYIKKGCPKTTFLGLCFSGKIKDMRITPKKLDYKNAYYGITMLETLQNNVIPNIMNDEKAFWQYHVDNFGFTKTRNHQYIVVKTMFDGWYCI